MARQTTEGLWKAEGVTWGKGRAPSFYADASSPLALGIAPQQTSPWSEDDENDEDHWQCSTLCIKGTWDVGCGPRTKG